MPRTIMIPEEELQQELNREYAKGFSAGRVQIINAVNAILAGKGDEVQVTETAEKEIKEFIEGLKNDSRLQN